MMTLVRVPEEEHFRIIACILPRVQFLVHFTRRCPMLPLVPCVLPLIGILKGKRKREEGDTDIIPAAVKLLKEEIGKAPPSSLSLSAAFRRIVGPLLSTCPSRMRMVWFGGHSEARDSVRATGFRLRRQRIPGTNLTTDGNLTGIIMPAVIKECEKTFSLESP